ncbi:unnamed protein product, partial [Symbiodinium sp. KB8]
AGAASAATKSVPLVRFHSESVFNRFPLLDRSYKKRYQQSILRIVEHGWGLVTLFFHDGRGRGLGGVLVDGQRKGVVADTRDFKAASWVLQRHLRGATAVKVLASGQHATIAAALRQYSVEVKEWVFVGDAELDRGHALLRARAASLPTTLRSMLSDEVPAFPTGAGSDAGAKLSAEELAAARAAADIPALDPAAVFGADVDPSTANWVITGVGSSEAHGRYLVSLLQRHTGASARFAPLTAFLDVDVGPGSASTGTPAPKSSESLVDGSHLGRLASGVQTDAAGSGRRSILVVISQGLSPNSWAALRHMHAFDRVILFTSVSTRHRPDKDARIQSVRAHPGGGAVVTFPMEDEYGVLVRVVGPACGFLRVYQCVRAWCAPSLPDPAIVLPAVEAAEAAPVPKAVRETLIASARCMSKGLLRKSEDGADAAGPQPAFGADESEEEDGTPPAAAAAASAADKKSAIPSRATPLRDVAFVASPPLSDYLINACKKFEEGMLLATPSVSDYLSFPHGKHQLLLLSHRRDPALAGRAQADSVVVLLDSGRPADRRIATMAEDMVAAEGIPVWRIPSALPVDLQVIEFEAVLNRLMLDVIIEGDVDQCHWPGHDGESALYHVVR